MYRTTKTQNVLRNSHSNNEDITLPALKLFYKLIAIKTELYWYKWIHMSLKEN